MSLIDRVEETAYVELAERIDHDEAGSAAALAEWALANVRPKSVVDLGCSSGLYLVPFAAAGCAVLGVDAIPSPPGGAHLCAKEYRQKDLRVPFVLSLTPSRYDLCLCLETMEHLDAAYHKVLVRTIAGCADTVIFSCAVPGQGGVYHKAERTHTDVIDLFRAERYQAEEQDTQHLRDYLRAAGAVSWLVNNVFVFMRSNDGQE